MHDRLDFKKAKYFHKQKIFNPQFVSPEAASGGVL